MTLTYPPPLAGVRDLFYRHWMLACPPMAAVIGAVLLSSPPAELALTLVWLQFVVYLLHESEEHVWPGGFKDYVNARVVGPALHARYPGATVPDHDFPLDDRAVFWINISFVWVAFPLFAVLAGTVDMRFGLLPPWLGIVNASVHILTAILKRGYNPGLLVSVCLNIPTGIWTLGVLGAAGAGVGAQLLGLGVAVIGHLALIASLVPRMRRVVAASG